MSTALFDLSGRTALVTGSSRGLGRAIAEGMAKAGARLIINGVDPDRVEKTVAEFRAAGHQADGVAFDVTDEPAVVGAFERFDREGIAVDILVNNAGIQRRKPLVEFTTEEWRKVIETNLTSAFIAGREAARRMIPRKRGKIINIGSLGSELARPTIAPYTAAKGGIRNLTRSMAVEWAQSGIQANAIGPGYMLTDMNEALMSNPEFNNWLMSRVPAKRWGKPDELVGAAIFLASEASNYVNGQTIYVDGGMLAAM
ncbi:glucose 1-dehydrogenase [Bradyrhizobium jicamae]|uniref:Glucose 1-dehydrogenase n=1 Tax=Bradyrhizobium jicamae TaxID=280332 RepID=A0ABS5FMK1_9BRAD|nr:glucose 1-dehydrogenase [Bradyrhizobium jicamae]MBR0798010.1 glucose 1-dehydrogenase [Bradyrhizobium jicamae]MBR0934398.1 glucose 1-dehydrogenase [Bradyrhizobium jicamae]